MKKVSLLFLCTFISPAFATGIGTGTTNAPCDNATLSKYNGTADIEINWEPNTIGLTWYDGDTQLNVPTASQTCTYDGMITVPPTPQQKPGYTFNGWKIQQTSSATCGMEQLDTSIKGIKFASLTPTLNRYTAEYGIITNNTWAVEFTYGVVYGSAMCSSSLASRPTISTPSTTDGRGCWCRATGFTATGNDYTKGPKCILSPLSNLWVLVDNFPTDDQCTHQCAYNCSSRFYIGDEANIDTFRPAVFSIIGR